MDGTHPTTASDYSAPPVLTSTTDLLLTTSAGHRGQSLWSPPTGGTTPGAARTFLLQPGSAVPTTPALLLLGPGKVLRARAARVCVPLAERGALW